MSNVVDKADQVIRAQRQREQRKQEMAKVHAKLEYLLRASKR